MKMKKIKLMTFLLGMIFITTSNKESKKDFVLPVTPPFPPGILPIVPPPSPFLPTAGILPVVPSASPILPPPQLLPPSPTLVPTASLVQSSLVNIDCVVKEGYVFMVNPSPIHTASDLITVKITMSLTDFTARMIDNSIVLNIGLNDIQAVQKSNNSGNCFEVFHMNGNPIKFCEMTNLGQISADMWVKDIMKFKVECLTIPNLYNDYTFNTHAGNNSPGNETYMKNFLDTANQILTKIEKLNEISQVQHKTEDKEKENDDMNHLKHVEVISRKRPSLHKRTTKKRRQTSEEENQYEDQHLHIHHSNGKTDKLDKKMEAFLEKEHSRAKTFERASKSVKLNQENRENYEDKVETKITKKVETKTDTEIKQITENDQSSNAVKGSTSNKHLKLRCILINEDTNLPVESNTNIQNVSPERSLTTQSSSLGSNISTSGTSTQNSIPLNNTNSNETSSIEPNLSTSSDTSTQNSIPLNNTNNNQPQEATWLNVLTCFTPFRDLKRYYYQMKIKPNDVNNEYRPVAFCPFCCRLELSFDDQAKDCCIERCSNMKTGSEKYSMGCVNYRFRYNDRLTTIGEIQTKDQPLPLLRPNIPGMIPVSVYN